MSILRDTLINGALTILGALRMDDQDTSRACIIGSSDFVELRTAQDAGNILRLNHTQYASRKSYQGYLQVSSSGSMLSNVLTTHQTDIDLIIHESRWNVYTFDRSSSQQSDFDNMVITGLRMFANTSPASAEFTNAPPSSTPTQWILSSIRSTKHTKHAVQITTPLHDTQGLNEYPVSIRRATTIRTDGQKIECWSSWFNLGYDGDMMQTAKCLVDYNTGKIREYSYDDETGSYITYKAIYCGWKDSPAVGHQATNIIDHVAGYIGSGPYWSQSTISGNAQYSYVTPYLASFANINGTPELLPIAAHHVTVDNATTINPSYYKLVVGSDRSADFTLSIAET